MHYYINESKHEFDWIDGFYFNGSVILKSTNEEFTFKQLLNGDAGNDIVEGINDTLHAFMNSHSNELVKFTNKNFFPSSRKPYGVEKIYLSDIDAEINRSDNGYGLEFAAKFDRDLYKDEYYDADEAVNILCQYIIDKKYFTNLPLRYYDKEGILINGKYIHNINDKFTIKFSD